MALLASNPRTLAGRFDLLRVLGEGGSGVVYEARDRQSGSHVALKLLHRLTPRALERFKTEFRTVAEIDHRNLVRLGELFEDDGRWFFTMEQIAGTDFKRYTRADRATGEAPDLDRLRNALGQLAEAVLTLHGAELLHRDIKPDNVRVAPDGRVVLLDFGLVTELAADRQSTMDTIHGTASYMAPEQVAAQNLGPPADWYAVGALLFEGLTGRPPFVGASTHVLLQKLRQPAPLASDMVPGLPEDLVQLCSQLLEREASERATATSVLRVVGGAVSTQYHSIPVSTASAARFVGREDELQRLGQRLDDARQAGLRMVLLEGESGIGKTALVEEFIARSTETRPGLLALRGRCHAKERVPFKAFDRAVDGVARLLRRLDEQRCADLIAGGTDALAQVFPVLASVPAIERQQLQAGDGPTSLRLRAFRQATELFSRLAREYELVLCMDDLHWADEESGALLARLLADARRLPMLIVATARPLASTAAIARRLGPLLEHPSVFRTPLGPLSDNETLLLGRALLGSSAQRAESLLGEAAGHPLFIAELARHARDAGFVPQEQLSLDDSIRARIARLEDAAGLVMRMLAVASAPVDRLVLVHGCRAEPEELEVALRALRVERLARPERDGRVSCYHDRVRESVLAGLQPEELRQIHARLAMGMRGTDNPEPEPLAHHLAASGDHASAAVHAVEAANRAERGLAFNRAAELYQHALEWSRAEGEQRRAMVVKTGDLLAKAGRAADAAGLYLGAHAQGSQDQELLRRAAEQLLRCGQLERGLYVLEDALSAAGLRLPSTPRKALLALLFRRARLRLRGLDGPTRDLRDVAPATLQRLDTCYSAAIGLGMVNTISASDFQARHLIEAMDAGEPYRMARAIALEAAHRATAGRPAWDNCQTLLQRANELAELSGEAHARGMVRMCRGIAAHLCEHWQPSEEQLGLAVDVFRSECHGVEYEITSCRTFQLWNLFQLGEVARLIELAPRYLEEALSTGDRYAAATCSTYHAALGWLARDEAQQARRLSMEVAAGWSAMGFHTQHLAANAGLVDIDLYEGHVEQAFHRAESTWENASRAMLTRVAKVRVEQIAQRGKSALALSMVRSGDSLGQARRQAGRLLRAKSSWASGHGLLLRAGIRNVEGDQQGALADLRQAQVCFETQHLYRRAARYCEGLILGGEAGAQQVCEEQTWLCGQGVQRPDRVVAMLVPGFEPVQ